MECKNRLYMKYNKTVWLCTKIFGIFMGVVFRTPQVAALGRGGTDRDGG